MTTRFHALTVVLDRDIREDDAEALMLAIRQLRGVAGVAGVPVDICDYSARTRASDQILRKLREVLYEAKEANPSLDGGSY